MGQSKIQVSPLEGLVPLDREVVEMLTAAICANFPRWDKPRATERARASEQPGSTTMTAR